MNLSKRSFAGLKWSYAGAAVRLISQLAVGVVLARILGPEPFGLVAIAWIVVGLGNLIADLGFSSAVVQREDLTKDDVRFVFTLQILIGAGMSAFVALAAPWLASFFRRPDAASVVAAMGMTFLIQAFGQTATAILKRNLNFATIQAAQIVSYVGSFLGLGVALAFLGFGVWSIVWAQLMQAALYAVIVYLYVKHSMWPLWSRGGAGYFRFGSAIMGTNLINWSINNVDNAIVGRVNGIVDLGLYSRAYNLVNSPMGTVVSTLQGVLFPAYSRAQDNLLALKRTYLASLGIVALICAPVFFAAATVSDTLVISLYGRDWGLAGPLLIPLSLAMPVNALAALAGPLLTGVGRIKRELRVQGMTLIGLVPCVIVASFHSLQAVAWTVLAVYIARLALVNWVTLPIVGAKWRDLGQVLWNPLLVALATAAGTKLVDHIVGQLSFSATPRLLCDLVIGSTVAAMSILLLRRTLLRGPIGAFARSVSENLPQRVRPWLQLPLPRTGP